MATVHQAEIPTVWQLRPANFEDVAARSDSKGFEPCEICGRPIKDPSKAASFEYDIQGRIIPDGHPDSDHEQESMGWWTIGPECVKKLKNVRQRP